MSGKRNDDGSDAEEDASPLRFSHALVSPHGSTPASDEHRRVDVMRWRKAERQRLIEERLALSPGERRSHAEAIGIGLDEVLRNVTGRIVSAYWPFRGEPDLRIWMERIIERGATCALPVVIERNMPLIFRTWRPRAKLVRGVWNIPVPAGGEKVMPDIVIAPVVGFDRECYRLGYGGGFFDRTLAAMPQKPRVVGVGYAQAAVQTIFPQAHDIAMDVIVTDEAILTPQVDGDRRP